MSDKEKVVPQPADTETTEKKHIDESTFIDFGIPSSPHDDRTVTKMQAPVQWPDPPEEKAKNSEE